MSQFLCVYPFCHWTSEEVLRNPGCLKTSAQEKSDYVDLITPFPLNYLLNEVFIQEGQMNFVTISWLRTAMGNLEERKLSH